MPIHAGGSFEPINRWKAFTDEELSQLARVATGHLGLEASVELADRELQRAEEGGDEPAAG